MEADIPLGWKSLNLELYDGTTDSDEHLDAFVTQENLYKHYTPMMASRTTILEEAFNLEVPNRLPPTKPPMSGLDATKYCRYHRGIGHNTEYYWALKDKIEELLQAGYVAQFVKKS
ncbi:hypothetical protein JHK84_050108 [Glycine max]|nr:hypothetical protein JHK84_050108 [Glycine max]